MKTRQIAHYQVKLANQIISRGRASLAIIKRQLAALVPHTVYGIAKAEALHHISLYEWDNCVVPLVSRENAELPATWNPRKWNGRGSGAYGLPQALPGSKMASEGKDWATSPATQIRWLIGYARSRYGSVCSANSYQLRNSYY